MDALSTRRFASWWITWEDLNWPDDDTLDGIRRRADAMAKSGVTSAIIFGTHFRWDWLPFFTWLHDYIATVTEECHKRGIEVFDHHSINLVHRYNTRDEMLHVMRDSGPHLPFSPSFEAAADWTYKGKKLNDWRMIDVVTREPVYYPQYTAEGFCYRNPEFTEAYFDYIKEMVATTGVDGLSADDSVHYMQYRTCACPSCRAEFKRRTGMELPPVEDGSFWGNFDNPAWNEWIDMRHQSSGDFHKKLRAVLPEKFTLVSCGARTAQPQCNAMGSDVREFLRGCDYGNVEMAGNIPPYKNDPKTINHSLLDNLVSASHHMAAGREVGKRCFGTVYAHTPETAEIAWAMNKITGADAWISELKGRLGLPRHILKTLPDEADIVGKPFLFEKEHPDLFGGDTIPQSAVYFSYETRNHTRFGGMVTGYYRDYVAINERLCKDGFSTHTIFDFPQDAKTYPVVFLPDAIRMNAQEKNALRRYLRAGGHVIAAGPTGFDGCEHHFTLENRADLLHEAFQTIGTGYAPWQKVELPPSEDENRWSEPETGLHYNPLRFSDETVLTAAIEMAKKWMHEMPVCVESSKGYLITTFQNGEAYNIHMLAEEYDTDIDHKLDEMRFHRSRVNIINRVEPIGISRDLIVRAEKKPTVYTPFCETAASVTREGERWHIVLPEKCAYAILRIV